MEKELQRMRKKRMSKYDRLGNEKLHVLVEY
jgi:hypothetical protein